MDKIITCNSEGMFLKIVLGTKYYVLSLMGYWGTRYQVPRTRYLGTVARFARDVIKYEPLIPHPKSAARREGGENTGGGLLLNAAKWLPAVLMLVL
ncbi:hypothetical protein KIH41_12545 [Litoribacter ruber]|uniref:hypothetical protein n=1 Tax=Litoribacter ruber TaxID=702568 RepID=UPI001BDA2B78|nr:hypothetical protein [Litoribacter ruber]MBT0812105.1 hypothetical protein [Litoribacter ruber]